MIGVKTNISDLRAHLATVRARFEGGVRAALDVAAHGAAAAARGAAPGKRMPKTIAARSLGPYVRRVASSSMVALWQDAGTRAHEILPRNVRMLRFKVNGATVFRRRVYHPGTKAVHFMRAGAVVGERILLNQLRRLLAELPK